MRCHPMHTDLLPDLAQARADYLASGDERALPIVDAHHHFWDLRNPPPGLPSCRVSRSATAITRRSAGISCPPTTPWRAVPTACGAML